jgi:hypothetical protein
MAAAGSRASFGLVRSPAQSVSSLQDLCFRRRGGSDRGAGLAWGGSRMATAFCSGIARVSGSASYVAAEMRKTIARSTYLLEKYSLTRADFICSHSRCIGRGTQEVFRLKSAQYPVLYPPVEMPELPPGIERDHDTVVFAGPLTERTGVISLVKAWLDKHPVKNVVILVDAKDGVSNSECTRIFPPALEKAGVKILDTISFQTGDIDFSAQVTKASGLTPDGVVLCGLYTESAHVVKEMRRQGMTQPIVAGIAVMSDRFNTLAGADANGVMSVTDFFAGNEDPTIAAWAKEYEMRFKNPPTNVGALTYDTLYLTRECIRQRGVAGKDLTADRTAIRDCWAQLKDAKAPLTGENTVTPEGYAIRKATIVTIQGGKMVASH